LINLINYDELKNSDFYQFFNIKEQGTTNKDNYTRIKVKTGGFQEYIDIKFYLNENREIEKGILLLDRNWVGNKESINPFGKDIVKSFILAVIPLEGNGKKIKDLAEHIFALKGENDQIIYLKENKPENKEITEGIVNILNVYKNKSDKAEYNLENSILTFENFEEEGNNYLKILWELKTFK
jgi:hypothetical protein